MFWPSTHTHTTHSRTPLLCDVRGTGSRFRGLTPVRLRPSRNSVGLSSDDDGKVKVLYIHTYQYTHTHVHTYTHIHTYIHLKHTYIHTCIHTHIHTHMHAYIHTCTQVGLPRDTHGACTAHTKCKLSGKAKQALSNTLGRTVGRPANRSTVHMSRVDVVYIAETAPEAIYGSGFRVASATSRQHADAHA